MEQRAYELISAPYPAELTETVNAYLAKGWQLHGPPFAHDGAFYQAVVAPAAAEVDKRLRRTSSDTSD
jgi:hypothetical protein